MTSKDFRRQVEGYGLTTAEILYRRPDHPWLLQAYVWVSLAVRARDPKASDLRRELAQQITADQRREGEQNVLEDWQRPPPGSAASHGA